MSKLYMAGIILTLVLSLGGGAVYYYNSTQNKIESLTKDKAILQGNVSVLEDANKTNVGTITDLQTQYQDMLDLNDEIQTDFQMVRISNDKLRKRLDDAGLEAIAAQKPGLVGTVINNATDKALRCFELLSGAPLNEREENAKTAKVFNSECPWLFNPR